ncbi:MAG: S46 family peptidase [Vicingaceae bacterium]
MKNRFSLLLSLSLCFQFAIAKEGMWLPMLLKSLNQSEMQSMGLKLSAEDIYSVNQSSLKDAVISFGGFCTGEIISDKGLILTNHHCGYGQIQYHSSVENDYLTNGYWAMKPDEELKNPGLTATFIVRMEDVTEGVLNGIDDGLNESERQKEIKKRIDSISEKAVEGTHYEAYIRPFFYGNEYYMFITETYKDIRLVGAPPSSIGKFGGDTDNWMWPRHTGDFSLFRIYADKDNKPAEYSEDNVPYTPKHYFPISMEGVKEGDFTMVYGFPGRTQEYLTSYAIQQIKEKINPARIDIREKALEIMDRHMKEKDEVRIKYASKYAIVSNYWKKWIGENRGLQKANAIQMKKEQEAAFLEATKGMKKYEGLMPAFEKRYQEIEKYAQARSYFIEIPYRKLEMIGLAASFRSSIKSAKNKEYDKVDVEKLEKKVAAHFKNFDYPTELELAVNLIEKYMNELPEEFQPEDLKKNKDKVKSYVTKVYENSIFNNQEEMDFFLRKFNKGTANRLSIDLGFKLMQSFYDIYYDKVRPEYSRLSGEIDSLSKIYVQGLREHVEGRYYPDANSTLRLAYGKVDDFKPRDAVEYDFFTTTDGILQKYDPGSADFDLPDRLVELIKKGDYGQYKDKDGYMHVCFTASNHTTGGNSGSPVLNDKGELIGLNFDRNWEGTMSDITYDINQCRNISVDIRYVLFVVDKFAGAGHLVKEMKLVNNTNEK